MDLLPEALSILTVIGLPTIYFYYIRRERKSLQAMVVGGHVDGAPNEDEIKSPTRETMSDMEKAQAERELSSRQMVYRDLSGARDETKEPLRRHDTPTTLRSPARSAPAPKATASAALVWNRKDILNHRVIMQIVFSLALFSASLFVVLAARYDQSSKHWAFGSIGTIIGFWLKGSR
jgi:hypothetical protein